ncbi:MAG: SDR family oxidoreductase [Vicingaceae bacterium]|nr:SDR family oxidoreductase [Vicingaceae bacterium]
MKKILIIGATSELAENFITSYEKAYELYFTARNCPKQTNNKWILVDFNNFNDTCFDNLPELDGMVYFAGITSHTPVKLTKKRHYDEVFNANFYGAFISVATLLKKNKIKSNASLVFLSSVASKYPYYGGALYTSSKMALEGFVKTLALELASKKIKVNAVSPTFVKGEMADSVANFTTASTIKEFDKKHPFGNINKNDVSELIHFLLSNKNNSITGQILQVGNFNTGLNN